MSQAKRHLYLVLKDCKTGYTVRKIDVDSFDSTDDHSDTEPVPEPPAFHVEADDDEHGQQQQTLFTALGHRILAMPQRAAVVPGFDTATLGLVVAPPPRQGQGDHHHRSVLVPAGVDRVYALGCGGVNRDDARHFEAMHAPAPPRRMRWQWGPVPAPPPFNPSFVTCHAAHPDGRAVFFSAEWSGSRKDSSGTFSFDTKRLEWTCHGAWLLPFAGQAHYDAEPDAWVGLRGRHHGDNGSGGVCSCDVVPPERRRAQAPAWKALAGVACEDRRRRVGAELVYMGDNIRFCLLECVEEPTTSKQQQQRLVGPPRRLLHVTAFGLKYGKQGELTTARRRQRRTYAVVGDAASFQAGKPTAFWM
ncbi:hypothetical protein QOZ80_1AG0012750 [Eleusine coracana subsp. coracana]|nr:hypothetical protein QOZ80_1AG0012750 [Eleusine coracana subsp. coracana]